MESKNNPEMLLAAHLAKPFLLQGQSGQPLALRCLPDGGMVVIAPDGRKLWFTALEVGKVRKALNQPAVKKPETQAGSKGITLHEPDPRKPKLTSRPCGGSRDGMSEIITLPESLKHVEELVDANTRRYQKPRPPNS